MSAPQEPLAILNSGNGEQPARHAPARSAGVRGETKNFGEDVIHSFNTQGVPSARWIGDQTRPEFLPLLSCLNQRMSVQCIRLDDALRSFPSADDIQLLVLATNFPGEYGAADCQALLDRYPRATLLQVLGAWCEAGGRTSSCDGRVQQIPWHAFPAWWAQRFDNVSCHASATSAPPASAAGLDVCIGVVAAHEEIADIYGSIFRSFRIPSDWLRSLTPHNRLDPFGAFVWDGTPCGRTLTASLPTLCALAGARPVVAVTTAVNIEAASDHNVSTIARPFQIDELVSLLWSRVSRQPVSAAPLARTA